MMNRIGRRNAIGLGTLAVIGVALFLFSRPDPNPATPGPGGDVGSDPLSALPWERGQVGHRPPPDTRPLPPPIGPAVDLGGGFRVAVEAVQVVPDLGIGAALGMPGRRRATTRGGRATTTPAAPATRARGTSAYNVGQRAQVRLRIDDPEPLADQDHRVRIAGHDADAMGNLELLGAPHGPAMFASGVVGLNDRRTRLEIARPTGPFVEVERIAPGESAPRRAAGAPMTVPWRILELTSPRLATGRTPRMSVRIEASDADASAFEGQSWLLQAICRDGRVLPVGGFQADSFLGTEVTFPVSIEDVAYVVYRCRPIEWRPIGEVDLPETEVEVRIGGASGTPPTTTTTASMAEVARLFQEYERAANQPTTAASRPGGGFGFRTKPATRPAPRRADGPPQ